MKFTRRLVCLLLVTVMCLAMFPISVGAASPAALTNPSITPTKMSSVNVNGVTVTTYYGEKSTAVTADGSFTVKWSNTESSYKFAVKLLDGEPDPGGSTETGKDIKSYTTSYTGNSYTITEANMSKAVGSWIKVYLGATTWNCHYYFKVSAPGHSDLEDEGPADMEDELGAPDDVTVTALDSNRIEIEWEKVSGATGYKVYRSSKSSKSSFTNAIATIKSGSTLSYIDKNLSANTKYYYRVTATKGGVESELSDFDYDTTDSLGPSAPENVSVLAQSSSSIKVSWSKVTGATGYKVYRSSSSSKSGFTSAIATITGGSTISYIDKGLAANTKYYYRVTAFDSNYESELSDYDYDWTDEEMKAVAAPASVSATTRGIGHIEITWGKVSDASGYKVYRATSSTDSSAVCIKEISGNSVLNYLDTGLSTGTKYYYWVKAVRNSEESDYSSRTNAVTAEVAKLATPNISPIYKKTVFADTGNYVASYYGTATATMANDAALTVNWVDTEGSYKLAVKVLSGEPDMVNFNDPGTSVYDATTSTGYIDNVYTLTKDVIASAAGKWIKVYLGCDYWNCHYYFKVKANNTEPAPDAEDETTATATAGGQAMADMALSLVGTHKSKLEFSKAYGNWCAAFVTDCARKLGLTGTGGVFSNTATVANPKNSVKSGKVWYFYNSYPGHRWNGSSWVSTDYTSLFTDNIGSLGKHYDPNRTVVPQKGDLVYFKKSDTEKKRNMLPPDGYDRTANSKPGGPWAHVGIVVDYNKSTRTIIYVDGNNHQNGTWVDGKASGGVPNSNYVNKMSLSLSNSLLMAIVRPAYSMEGVTYKITYDYGYGVIGGSTTGPTIEYGTKQYGKTYTLMAPAYSKYGYVFKGWAEHPDNLTVKYAPYASYTRNSDLYLYAVWEKSSNIPVTSVKVTRMTNGTKFEVGDTIHLVATVTPTNATNKTVSWSSSDISVATVSSSGYVTAKSAGTVLITATADGKKGTLMLVVTNVANGDHTPGDINGDGKVNSKDVRQLTRYLINKKTPVVVSACDTNGDGKVNSKDVRLLTRYLVNKKVTIY